MDPTGIIESAEKKYKQILEDFFVSVYNEKSLPSHGIEHHRRVWNYSREILELIPLDDIRFSSLPAKLIVASYLHDIGMSVDQGDRHGKQGRIFCLSFLKKNNLPDNEWLDVLDAIENHDDKDYDEEISDRSDLLMFLSVADDLDAFGFIGIYRYIEIYLSRRIDPKKMGYLIRENAEIRFENFELTFRPLKELVKKHRQRFAIVDNFFRKYNEQLPSYRFGTSRPSGYCGVIEIFLYLMQNQIEVKEFIREKEKYINDPVILWYFSELSKEMM